MDLSGASHLFRTLSDGTRIRLLALLESEELTVAELAAVTQLAQPRVSTHLARLKELDLVRDRRAGVSAYYRFNLDADAALLALWQSLRQATEDPQLNDDRMRLPSVLARRANEENWADTVAGDMERHYSPGRTWETLGRSLTRLLNLGDVLDVASGDGMLAELLSPQARSITCIDTSARVVDAAQKRLTENGNVRVELGDMHALKFSEASFDLVLLMHALTYTEQPPVVIREAARVLRPGGLLLASTLGKHEHSKAVEPFDHRNLGFTIAELAELAKSSGLEVLRSELSCRERRAPHFEVITLLARKPG
ncbi:MAG: metalloregulator ArsR/SmtB family transcription factor [Pseudomonadota bacterium]|nr:metalloregulator ArsR/SmtB family transcription factor [Pseudomonadota bacterium]